MYSNKELKEIVLYRYGTNRKLAAVKWLKAISSHGLKDSKEFADWIFGYLGDEPVEAFLRELSPKEISEYLYDIYIYFDQSQGFRDWKRRTEEFIEIHLELKGEKVLQFIFDHLYLEGGVLQGRSQSFL